MVKLNGNILHAGGLQSDDVTKHEVFGFQSLDDSKILVPNKGNRVDDRFKINHLFFSFGVE